MRKEIGSEFWSIPTVNTKRIINHDIKWFVSGRSALRAIINDCNIKTISLPFWCCDSMIIPFIDNNISVSFYNPFIDNPNINTDAILVMEYFGYKEEKDYSNFKGIVIRDLTHTLDFDYYNDSDYYFGSLRKWAGFYTGGYAWGFKKEIDYNLDESEYSILRKKAMEEKEKYINLESDSKTFLDIFKTSEEMLDSFGILSANKRDIEKFSYLDIEGIRKTRQENANVLLDYFRDKAIFKDVRKEDIPLFVPIRVENRDKLRKYLIENGIYCPVHWPVTCYHNLNENEKDFYDSELSLVCDQRYNKEDMLRIVSAIKKFEGR